MFQQTTIIGNLGNDPTSRYLPDGTPLTTFSVATNRKWTGSDGERREQTTWFRVTAWGKLADICGQHLVKGEKVLVVGTIEAQAFADKRSGEPRASLELRADQMRFLGGEQIGRTALRDNGEKVPAGVDDGTSF